MKTTIATVTLTATRNDIRWSIEGTVVAKGCTVEAPCTVQSSALPLSRWAYVFGSQDKGFAFLNTYKPCDPTNPTFTRKLRLTTLGYDRTDRVVTG